jgi:hypothetical protein
MVIFTDLTDTTFLFHCEYIGDKSSNWDYDFHIRSCGEEHIKSLDELDLLQLKQNCQNILKAISNSQGGY